MVRPATKQTLIEENQKSHKNIPGKIKIKIMEFIPAKTILQKSTHGDNWFGIDYNMNLYKGCPHGCIYCDSRSDCYQPEFDITNPIILT
jgi:DNA repair photolyase